MSTHQHAGGVEVVPAAVHPLRTIHTLWHGSPLSRLERLSTRSLLAHDPLFHRKRTGSFAVFVSSFGLAARPAWF